MRIALSSLLVASAVAGCAGPNMPSALPPDHPASADVTPASMPAKSETLALTNAPAVARSVEAAPSPNVDPHAGHDSGQGATPAGESSTSAPAAAAYVCPMHPEVTADQPDQRCPKCKMKLGARRAN